MYMPNVYATRRQIKLGCRPPWITSVKVGAVLGGKGHVGKNVGFGVVLKTP